METFRRSPIARQWMAEKGFTDEASYMTHLAKKERRDKAIAKKRAYKRRHNEPTKNDLKHFIAWDGEGITMPDGSHRYVIFANSEGDSIVNPNGIPTQDILDLLLRVGERHPKAIHVIFAGNYDANMWLLPSLSRGRAKRLSNLGKCTLTFEGTRYGIDYQPRHLFSVRELVYDPNKGPGGSFVKKRGITVWDVFGSYQMSFVKACRARLDDADLEEIEEIERMKNRRSGFTLDDLDEMLVYCRRELTALAKLALVDAEDSEAAGIIGQRRWDGAGAKASILLQGHGVKRHKADTPEGILLPVRTAYAGGRIETYRFGEYSGPVYTVDLRSAYPWAATFLPSLHGGRWVEADPDVSRLSPFSLIHLRYRGERLDTLHPFHWRNDKSAIAYPGATEGWYWWPEVHAAVECGVGGIELIEAIDFESASTEKPFDFIPDAFRARRLLDQQHKGRGWPLKLALNSVYGKLAQQLGARNGKPPTWHQLEWAGWITSRCRAEMFSLAYPRRDQLVTIETDGISFMGEPDEQILARVGTELGDYEVETYDGGVWVQSGIYWLLDHDGWWKAPKVRGVGSNKDGTSVLDRELFVEAYRQKAFHVAVPVTVNRFRGMVTSSLTPERWGDWCKWLDEVREIGVAPRGKRVHLGCTSACQDGLHGTLPTGGGGMSAPHRLAWLGKMGALFDGDEWWLNEQREADDEA
jgi:hypothetical protein